MSDHALQNNKDITEKSSDDNNNAIPSYWKLLQTENFTGRLIFIRFRIIIVSDCCSCGVWSIRDKLGKFILKK